MYSPYGVLPALGISYSPGGESGYSPYGEIQKKDIQKKLLQKKRTCKIAKKSKSSEIE